MTDPRVLMERDDATGIARITLNNPERRNCYDPAMRVQLGEYLDELAMNDAVKVVLLRGEGGVFSTGADMANAYSWYDEPTSDGNGRPRRPSQRRRLSVDRRTFDFYHDFMGYPKVTVAAVRGFALGGGLELALMADIAVVARDTMLGAPATRLLGPALGSLHMFFHRLGPVLARRLLLTGDTIPASAIEHLGVFTEVADDADVEARAGWWAEKASRMPADGIVAKEAFRLVEQLQAYQGEEVASYLFHAFGTNLQFDDGEFNFVKSRAEHGAKKALVGRDAERAVAAAASIGGDDGRAIGLAADLCVEDDAERALDDAQDELGAISGVAVTTGLGMHGQRTLLDAGDGAWQHTFDDVLLATVRACRAAVPLLVAGGGGAIVTTAAYSVRAPKPHQVPYASLKAGVATLTKTIAKGFGAQGIRANCVCPGATETDILAAMRVALARDRGWPEEEALERAMVEDWGMHVALGRAGRPEEVGDVIAFLLSERAGYVTGALVNVDGGTDF